MKSHKRKCFVRFRAWGSEMHAENIPILEMKGILRMLCVTVLILALIIRSPQIIEAISKAFGAL